MAPVPFRSGGTLPGRHHAKGRFGSQSRSATRFFQSAPLPAVDCRNLNAKFAAGVLFQGDGATHVGAQLARHRHNDDLAAVAHDGVARGIRRRQATLKARGSLGLERDAVLPRGALANTSPLELPQVGELARVLRRVVRFSAGIFVESVAVSR